MATVDSAPCGIVGSAPGGRDLSSRLTLVESTLVNLYQNKELHPPLESTLTKKPGGEGEYLFSQ
jgi:hypothetical protein